VNDKWRYAKTHRKICQMINIHTPKKFHYLSSFKLSSNHFPPVIHQFQIQVMVVNESLLEWHKWQYFTTPPYIPRPWFWLNKQYQAIHSTGHTYNEKKKYETKNTIILVQLAKTLMTSSEQTTLQNAHRSSHSWKYDSSVWCMALP
jgi:hypothetical protein